MAGARRMSRAGSRRRRESLAAMIGLAWVSACASGPPRPATAGAPPGPATAVPDWQEIPVAPLGTTIAAMHPGLHEILYFQSPRSADGSADGSADAPAGAGDVGAATDCYRANGPLPSVLNHASEDYVLCFLHDRLARVEAVLNLPAAEARALEQRLCEAWLPGSLASVSGDDVCGGRRGAAAFRVLLRSLKSDSGAALSIVVYTAAVVPSSPEGNQ